MRVSLLLEGVDQMYNSLQLSLVVMQCDFWSRVVQATLKALPECRCGWGGQVKEKRGGGKAEDLRGGVQEGENGFCKVPYHNISTQRDLWSKPYPCVASCSYDGKMGIDYAFSHHLY